MGYMAKQLRKIASGWNLEQEQQNTRYILRTPRVVSTILLTHYVLQIPSVQQRIHSLNVPLYAGQRSGIQAWNIGQKLGFLLGIGQGVSFDEWASLFRVTPKTIRGMYNDFGISVRLHPTLFIQHPQTDWAEQQSQAWYAESVQPKEIARRLSQSTTMISKWLGIPPMSNGGLQTIPTSPMVDQDGRIQISTLIDELKRLAIQWTHSTHPTHDNHFILRSFHSTYPLVLASVLLETCEKPLQDWWRWMIRESNVPLNFYRLRWLESLSRTGSVVCGRYPTAVYEQQLSKMGVPLDFDGQYDPRRGVAWEEWETICCMRWSQKVSPEQCAYRLGRSITEIPTTVRDAMNLQWSALSSKQPTVEEPMVAYQPTSTPKSTKPIWSEIERANLCTQCHTVPISPPFPKCLRCLLQVPSPKCNLHGEQSVPPPNAQRTSVA